MSTLGNDYKEEIDKKTSKISHQPFSSKKEDQDSPICRICLSAANTDETFVEPCKCDVRCI